MTEWKIYEVRKQIKKRNPVSGHQWTEEGDIIGFEVVGPFTRDHYKTYKKAEKELTISKAFYDKYPFDCPRTEKEKRYTERTA